MSIKTLSIIVSLNTLKKIPQSTIERILEFFTANIRNKNTRSAYLNAINAFFAWCDQRSLTLENLVPIHIASYIEQHPASAPTVKQHLAAIRMLFDYLVCGGHLKLNPAISVKGPKYIVKTGKTPVLDAFQTRLLLDSIDTKTISGKRDKALIALMVYSFARVSAIINLKVEDYFPKGKKWWIRLNEKGGKYHEVPVHHKCEEYLDHYLNFIQSNLNNKTKNIPSKENKISNHLLTKTSKIHIFRSLQKDRKSLTNKRLDRNDILRMIKRRAENINLPTTINCHTFRATGITTYLQNGGTLEHAQHIAAHESPKTTKLYDRTLDAISLDEIEKIIF